jgi:hypothetical protein
MNCEVHARRLGDRVEQINALEQQTLARNAFGFVYATSYRRIDQSRELGRVNLNIVAAKARQLCNFILQDCSGIGEQIEPFRGTPRRKMQATI